MKISPRCYAVTGLGYLPPWLVNAGFVVGDEITLVIDTGANALSAATIHGYATSVRPGNMLRVLDCEKHFDHIGGNSYLADRGAEVWGHFGINRSPQDFAAELAGHHSAVMAGTRLLNPSRPIEHEFEMALGNCVVEILLTPGHTETNISVWIPFERVLFPADTLVNGYAPNVGSASIHQWLASLDRLEALQPAVVVPGHGHVVFGDEIPGLFAHVRGALRSCATLGP